MKKGKIIDTKWKVEEEKEGGGQGQVYKVSCEKLPGEVFALKFLKQQKCEERRKRMYREVCNISKLSDEHIMNIVDSNVESYEDDNIKLYYVSNYIEGETLEKFVTENVVSFECALAFFKDFLQVISYCHENNIIHRDIKPDNILLHDNILEKFVIIDFGLSFNLEEEDDVTTINQQLGNRFLLLPELVSGNKEQKRLVESDISQACAIFFYLMTGTIPNALLDGDGKMPHRRIEANDIIRNKISNDVVRQNIFHIFDKAFSNNVSERYHSVTEIYDDLKMLEEIKVNEMGKEIIMKNEIINVEIENEKELYRYSELMRQLNPCTEICNPAGLTLPQVTNVCELVEFGIALPQPVKNKVARYYKACDYVTAANTIWLRAIGLLRKRILSLGEEFVADMVETDDLSYVRELPAYKVIDLAHELGFIDKAGSRKLQLANDYYNYFNNDEADDYEEMPQDEANIIIKNCIGYILYTGDESFGLQFNDFRERLKSGKVIELFDDDETMFETCPYFFLKTSVRSLLKLFRDTEGIEFDNVSANMKYMFPVIWKRLKIEEKRALADAYTDYTEGADVKRTTVLNAVMLQVHGFDYVKENVRSRTYIQVARKLVDVHFGMQNFYNEPSAIKTLEDLGDRIPKLAMKECITAVLYVKLGNQYGTSWDAETIADRILDKLTEEEWITYLERYMVDESHLLDCIESCIKMRKQWKLVINKYKLNEISLIAPRAKKLVKL